MYLSKRDAAMIELTDSDKLVIIACCAAFLSLTVIMTVCVVTPSCWIYHCIWGKNEDERKRKRQLALYGGTEVIPLPTAAVQVNKHQNPDGTEPTVDPTGPVTLLRNLGGKKTRDSTYSSMSSSSRGENSIYSEVSAEAMNDNGEDGSTIQGHVTFTMRFQLKDENDQSPGENNNGTPTIGQLFVNLREIQDLPVRPYGGLCDPYIVVKILKDRKNRKRSKKNNPHKLCQYQSDVKKRTQCPLFNETFVISLTKNDLKECSIHLGAYDLVKFANDTLVGEVSTPFKDYNFLESSEEYVVTLDFKEAQQCYGELLLGLSYLPTAERLTINVMKATNLVSPFTNVDTFYPCVRVMLFHQGKIIKKKKTTAKKGTLAPVYNEQLTFDLPQDEIDNVAFVAVVSHRDPSEANSVSSPDSPTSPADKKNDHHIGKVILGAGSKGSAHRHWLAMKQSPRKQVTHWHTLR